MTNIIRYSLDTLDPVSHIIAGSSGHFVHAVSSLHHLTSLLIRLTSFDHLGVESEELKAVSSRLFLSTFTNRQTLKWYNTTRLFILSYTKV